MSDKQATRNIRSRLQLPPPEVCDPHWIRIHDQQALIWRSKDGWRAWLGRHWGSKPHGPFVDREALLTALEENVVRFGDVLPPCVGK